MLQLADLCLRVVPGLFEVAAGRLALVGDTAPSATLSERGLIAASQVVCPVDASTDDRWSADAIHRAVAGRPDDVLMLVRYVGRAGMGLAASLVVQPEGVGVRR